MGWKSKKSGRNKGQHFFADDRKPKKVKDVLGADKKCREAEFDRIVQDDISEYGVPTEDLEFMGKKGYLPDGDKMSDADWELWYKILGIPKSCSEPTKHENWQLPHDENGFLNKKWADIEP